MITTGMMMTIAGSVDGQVEGDGDDRREHADQEPDAQRRLHEGFIGANGPNL